MIYLNGQIGAVYMNGRYHSEVYLGSVLVWQNVKKIPGEAHAQLAFENTADGVAAVLLPGDAAEALAMTANVTAQAHGMADGSADGTLIVDAQIMPQEHGVANGKATETLEIRPTINESVLHTPNGIAINALLLQSSVLGRDIIINKRQITELLELHTPILPAVGVIFHPVTPGCALAMGTTVPSGVAVVLNPFKFGSKLTLTMRVPPATEAVLKDSQAKLALQFMPNAPSGEPADVVKCIADGEEQIQTTADGLSVFGVDGDAASEMEMRGAARPETLEVDPQEAADNLRLRFAAEWTRGVGEKSSEDCEITAQAVGYAQMGDVVLIGIEGGQTLQLTASVVGTAGEPVLEKTRAAMFVDGTLETVEAADFGSLTALPAYALTADGPKKVFLPDTVKTVSENVIYWNDSIVYVRCSPNVSEIPSRWWTAADSELGKSTLDCTSYTNVPTLKTQESTDKGTISFDFVKVPNNLLSQWKAASKWSDIADKIVAG